MFALAYAFECAALKDREVWNFGHIYYVVHCIGGVLMLVRGRNRCVHRRCEEVRGKNLKEVVTAYGNGDMSLDGVGFYLRSACIKRSYRLRSVTRSRQTLKLYEV